MFSQCAVIVATFTLSPIKDAMQQYGGGRGGSTGVTEVM